MFIQRKVVEALERNVDRFSRYQRISHEQADLFRRQLCILAGWSRAELEAALADCTYPGALPSAEQDAYDRPVIPFDLAWSNHEEARAWAAQVLRGRPTFAVDGSQIPSQRAYSIPVALVQIGWYENLHASGGSYEKDVAVEVLPPEDITYPEGDLHGVDSEILVALHRYRLETARVRRYLAEHAGDPTRPIVFFDGSLVASFAARLPDTIRAAYTQMTVEMLAESEHAGVALFGFVDTSYAVDLITMLRSATQLGDTRLADAGLLAPLMAWGDRSPAYVCARDAVLDGYGPYRRGVGFVYLKTTAHNPPARVEFPLWMLERGRLDDALEVVRAETVVGNGYPYPLETADAVAVLTVEDRERFHRTFQQFAEEHGLPLHYSRKALSKRQRRT